MKHYGELLADDPAWARRAARVAARTVDAIELQPAAAARGRPRLRCTDACHHLNASPVADLAHRMLQEAGAEPCGLADDGRCCGAAGATYALSQPELSARLGRQKAEAIIATGARVVAVSNPGCASQIAKSLRDAGSDVTRSRTPRNCCQAAPRGALSAHPARRIGAGCASDIRSVALGDDVDRRAGRHAACDLGDRRVAEAHTAMAGGRAQSRRSIGAVHRHPDPGPPSKRFSRVECAVNVTMYGPKNAFGFSWAHDLADRKAPSRRGVRAATHRDLEAGDATTATQNQRLAGTDINLDPPRC